MATLSQQLKNGVPDFAKLAVDDANPHGPSLYLPGPLVKAIRDETEARAKLAGRRGRGAKLLKTYAKPNFPNGKFFDDMGSISALGLVGNGLKKPIGTLSFGALRALGMIWIDRLIINARKAQMRRFAQICDAPGKQLGFRCVHRKYQNVDFNTDTPEIRARCKEMDDRLRSVTRPVHKNFGDLLENMIEEELVIDRRVLILPQSRGGKIGSYHMTDGEYIRPRVEVLAAWMLANHEDDPDVATRKMQLELFRNPTVGLDGTRTVVDFANAAYVQIVSERIVDAWEEGHIYVGIAHPTIRMNQWGYGRSALEDSFGLSMLFMRAMRFNENLFDVNYPDAILAISGAIDEEGLGAFKSNIFDYNPAEASTRLPIINGGDIAEEFKAELIKLRDTPKDMLMTELIRFVCNLKCAAYGMHPSEINVTPDGQGGAVVNVDQSQGDEIAQATERGFHSLAYGQADMFTDALIIPDYDDLMYIIEGLDREGEQGQAAKIESYSTHSTFNEIRAMRDQKPMPKGIPVDPGDWLMNDVYVQIAQSLTQQAQAQAQQNMGSYEQGNFGQPDGDDAGAPFGGAQGGPGGGAPGGPPGAPGGPPAGSGAVPGAGGAPGPSLGAPRPPTAPAPGKKPGNPLFRSRELAPVAHFHGNGHIDWLGEDDE